jgi:hypothetical protein
MGRQEIREDLVDPAQIALIGPRSARPEVHLPEALTGDGDHSTLPIRQEP